MRSVPPSIQRPDYVEQGGELFLRGYHGDMERYNQQLEVRIVLCLFVILMRMYAPTDQTFACFAHVARCVRAATPRNGMLPQLPFKNAETEVWFKTWDAGVPST